MAVGILTSSAVTAAAAYGIAVAVSSAHQPRPSARVATASSGAPDPRRSSRAGPFAWLASTAAPTTWTRLTLPSGLGSLSVPPGFRAVRGDPGTATLALLGPDSTYLGYLNVTPRQGDERLAGWAAFRLAHLRGDGSISAIQDGAVQSVGSGPSLRSCVSDDYVTEIGHHRFHEVACLVMTTSAGSVVVAATPSGDPAHLWTQLERAVAGDRPPTPTHLEFARSDDPASTRDTGRPNHRTLTNDIHCSTVDTPTPPTISILPSPITTPPTTTPPTTNNGIPQGNGGDHDADNNGGPSDGNGNL